MYTQRTTEWADALERHKRQLEGLTKRLAQPMLPADERVDVVFQLTQQAIGVANLAETIRRGNRPQGKAKAA